MKLGRVVGSVVCSQLTETLRGERLLLVQPISETGEPAGRPLVACDTCQAGPGDQVLYEGGREAAMALRHSFNPSDAAVMAVVDELVSDEPATTKPRAAKPTTTKPAAAKPAAAKPRAGS